MGKNQDIPGFSKMKLTTKFFVLGLYIFPNVIK